MRGPLAGVGAVIVHYRRWPETSSTVQDVLHGDIDPRLVVVVDNGSKDADADEFTALFPDCSWISGHGNIGYAGAVNLGVRHLRNLGVDLVLVLTHEVRFAPELPRQLREALNAAEGADAAAPRLRRLSAPDAVWSEGGDLNRFTCLPRSRETLVDSQPQWVDGCCFMVSVDAFTAIGGMYEPYFLYMEEVDFFVKLRDSGRHLLIVPDAFALQEPGSMSLHHATRNRVLLAYRVGKRGSRAFVVLETLVRLLHGYALRRGAENRSKQAERWRALREGVQAGRASRRRS